MKNIVKNVISAQKQMADSTNNGSRWNIASFSSSSSPVPIQYIEQFTRQLDEFTNNTLRVSNLNNQFTITRS